MFVLVAMQFNIVQSKGCFFIFLHSNWLSAVVLSLQETTEPQEGHDGFQTMKELELHLKFAIDHFEIGMIRHANALKDLHIYYLSNVSQRGICSEILGVPSRTCTLNIIILLDLRHFRAQPVL